MLTTENEKRHLEISKRNLEMLQSDPDQFFHHDVTMDKTWVHHFDPETKNVLETTILSTHEKISSSSYRWQSYGLCVLG